MERKKSQLLFNFLPEDTFNHSRNGTICRMDWIFRDRKSEVDALPESYILERIRPQIQKWPNDVPLRSGSLEIVSPSDAKFQLFPRVFECRECYACTRFREDQIKNGRPAECGNCGRQLTDTEQLSFVVVCPGGTIESLPVPSCSSCGDKNPKFVRPTSSLEDAFWECSNCQNRICGAYDPVSHCDYCGQGKQIKVHSSSTTFYPQIENFVNIDDKDLEYVTNNEHYQKDTIAEYLLDASVDSTDTEVDVDPATLDRLGVTEEEFKEAQEDTAEEIEEQRDREVEWIEGSLEPDTLRELSEEIFEYQSILGEKSNDVGGQTLSGILDNIDHRPELEAGVISDFLEKKDAMNIAEVRLIEDFPITTVVYGYSRLNPGPGENSHLNTFRGKDGDDRMFAQTAKAEAVMFSLDEEQVARWLLQNGVIDEMPSDPERWFLEELQPYPYYRELDPSEHEDSQVARYTLALLHTLSHSVMYSIDALSGYSKASLMEYLLPHTLSFVVYKHSDTDFSLGAMHTLFENRFDEVHDYILDDSDVCMYDPVCEHEENGACEGCLFISSISCDNGNHNLSRSTLHGGRFDDGVIDGFLNV